MKRKKTSKMGLAAVLAVVALGVSAQEKGSLTVRIEGLRNSKGTVLIALSDKEIPTDNQFLGANMAKADSAGMAFFFEQVPAIPVYVQVFHDENGNFQLDRTPEGIPAEGVGSVPGSRALPAFTVKADQKNELTVQMSYFK